MNIHPNDMDLVHAERELRRVKREDAASEYRDALEARVKFLLDALVRSWGHSGGRNALGR